MAKATCKNDYGDILTEITDLLERKDSDYGQSFSKLYKEFGMLSTVIRLSDKLERLKSLIGQDQKVLDESIDDTLQDLIGYGILTLRERGNRNGRE